MLSMSSAALGHSGSTTLLASALVIPGGGISPTPSSKSMAPKARTSPAATGSPSDDAWE
jgi:hypothetical protein